MRAFQGDLVEWNDGPEVFTGAVVAVDSDAAGVHRYLVFVRAPARGDVIWIRAERIFKVVRRD